MSRLRSEIRNRSSTEVNGNRKTLIKGLTVGSN